jgi:hypothetical protein
MAALMVQVVGWLGSALLVFSLLQSRMMRLRVLNLVAAVILVAFNAVLQVWPMVGMNAAVAAIDIYFIVRLTRQRRLEPQA